MRENKPKFEVPIPCNQNWNKMRPKEEGRYCLSCSKVVVDFTQMTTEEIQIYFIQHSGQSTCGHFKTSQVVTPLSGFKTKIVNLYSKSERIIRVKYIKKITLIVLGVVMFIAGCRSRTQGEMVCSPDKSSKKIKKERDIMGDTIYVEPKH